jgi:hypothetical protein
MSKRPQSENTEEYFATTTDDVGSIDDFALSLPMSAKRSNSAELKIIGARISISILQSIKQARDGKFKVASYFRQWRQQANAFRTGQNKPE